MNALNDLFLGILDILKYALWFACKTKLTMNKVYILSLPSNGFSAL